MDKNTKLQHIEDKILDLKNIIKSLSSIIKYHKEEIKILLEEKNKEKIKSKQQEIGFRYSQKQNLEALQPEMDDQRI